jgi:hypothetical protein
VRDRVQVRGDADGRLAELTLPEQPEREEEEVKLLDEPGGSGGVHVDLMVINTRINTYGNVSLHRRVRNVLFGARATRLAASMGAAELGLGLLGGGEGQLAAGPWVK